MNDDQIHERCDGSSGLPDITDILPLMNSFLDVPWIFLDFSATGHIFGSIFEAI